MIEVYQPSGKLDITSFFLVGLGTVIMVVAGWIYQLLVNWNPLIILNVLLLVGLAFAGMFVTLTVIQYGKVRNPIVGIFFGVLIGMVAIATSHYSAYLREADASQELTFSEYIDQRVEGGWTLRRRPGSESTKSVVSGIFVYLIWLLEMGAIVGTCVWGSKPTDPFCELTGKWADEEEIVWLRDDLSAVAIDQLGQATDKHQLWDIESSSEPDSTTITWQIKRTASDEGMQFLTIEKNWVEVDSEGEESQFSEPIIDNVILQPSDIEALLAARDAHTAATPSAEAVISSDLEGGLNSKYKELVQILDQIIDLLEEDESHWLEYMTTARKLLLKADRSGIEHLLGAYGGMGSFNDLVIGQSEVNGAFQWKLGAEENNDKLDSLRSRAYELAVQLKIDGRMIR